MSFNPRKTPCMASDRRTAGDPSDLSVKYCCAGISIGDFCGGGKISFSSEQDIEI